MNNMYIIAKEGYLRFEKPGKIKDKDIIRIIRSPAYVR